jgi:Family of unknown function (DUF6159)
MGTLSRSWDLLKQSLSVLMSDKELMWLPVLSGIFCLLAMVTICGTGFLYVLPAGPIPHDAVQQKELARQMAPFMFVFYVVSYSVTTYFNVALVSIAANRLAGGHARLNDGLQLAWQRKWVILQWALLAATVGMLLQMLDERRLGFIGRMITWATGVVWTIASFFVIPIIAAEGLGPIDALGKSAQLFRKTWGERAVAAFSFGAIFLLLALPGMALPIMGPMYLGKGGAPAGLALALIYFLILAILSSAARGVFLAAVYRYATTQQVSGGFQLEDLAGGWRPKTGFSSY